MKKIKAIILCSIVFFCLGGVFHSPERNFVFIPKNTEIQNNN